MATKQNSTPVRTDLALLVMASPPKDHVLKIASPPKDHVTNTNGYILAISPFL